MSPTLIKICGITRFEDGMAALDAGADWLGFIRYSKSKRHRSIEDCADVIARLRENSSREFQAVAVYVDAPEDVIRAEIDRAGFDRVQLHGAETMQIVRALAVDVPVIKAIKISDSESLARAENFPGVDLLTDTDDPNLPGGTGRGYDVGLLEALVASRRVIVAGGLKADNVGEVVRRLHPFGVDVSSGVEASPGIKDPTAILDFIQAVREADAGE